MRVRVVGVLVLLLALSGCSTFAGGISNTPTLTPADVPTETPPSADPRVGVAPGVSASGITDSGFLADRHVAIAKQTSYAWRERFHEETTTANVSTSVNATQRIVVENESVYRRNTSGMAVQIDDQQRTPIGFSEYADGNVRFRSWFEPDDDGRDFRRYPDPENHASFASFPADAITRYLSLESASVSRVAVDGSERQHYLVRGTNVTHDAVTDVENYRARAVIRSDGFVRSLNVSYETSYDGRTVSVHYRFSYRQVGTATVTPPPWLSSARATFE